MTRLYPDVPVKGLSFKGVKKLTVPKQSMSLREILRRFVRRESLPVEKVGTYEDRFGDLEKICRLDITEQFEYAQRWKDLQAKYVRQEEDRAKARAAAAALKGTAAIHPVGEQPNQTPPPQGA